MYKTIKTHLHITEKVSTRDKRTYESLWCLCGQYTILYMRIYLIDFSSLLFYPLFASVDSKAEAPKAAVVKENVSHP